MRARVTDRLLGTERSQAETQSASTAEEGAISQGIVPAERDRGHPGEEITTTEADGEAIAAEAGQIPGTETETEEEEMTTEEGTAEETPGATKEAGIETGMIREVTTETGGIVEKSTMTAEETGEETPEKETMPVMSLADMASRDKIEMITEGAVEIDQRVQEVTTEGLTHGLTQMNG